MAVKIKLKRMGKIRAPYYRIVVADSRTKRDGRAIEEIGKYHPTQEPSLIEVDSERAQYWLGVGAQPTEPVAAILKITGDWQKFKGLPGAEGTLRIAEPQGRQEGHLRGGCQGLGRGGQGGRHDPEEAGRQEDRRRGGARRGRCARRGRRARRGRCAAEAPPPRRRRRRARRGDRRRGAEDRGAGRRGRSRGEPAAEAAPAADES